MIKYVLFKLVHRLVLILPTKWSYWIGCRAADIDYVLKRKQRKAVKSNLQCIFSTVYSGNVPKSLVSANARLVFRNFAKYLVDFFSFARLRPDNIHKFVKITGLEHIQDAFKKGRGVVALTAHIGNWELCGVVTALLGFNVNAVALSHENTKINRLFVNQRSAKGVNVIPIGSPPSIYLDVLRKNQLIGLVGDRITSDSGIEIDFFKRPTYVPKGPAVLSLRTGAPVVPAFMIRMPDDKFNLIFEEPIDPEDFINNNSHCVNPVREFRPLIPPLAGRKGGIKPPFASSHPMTGSGAFSNGVKGMTNRIVSVLEKYIKKYPSQWFLFYKVWS